MLFPSLQQYRLNLPTVANNFTVRRLVPCHSASSLVRIFINEIIVHGGQRGQNRMNWASSHPVCNWGVFSESGMCGSSIAEAWESLLCLNHCQGTQELQPRAQSTPFWQFAYLWGGQSYIMLWICGLALPSIERKETLCALGVHHTMQDAIHVAKSCDISTWTPFPTHVCFWWTCGRKGKARGACIQCICERGC